MYYGPENVKRFLDKGHIQNIDYHKAIKGKNVILIAPGSNSLHVPNCRDLISSFDMIVGIKYIIEALKQYPYILGDRLDALYFCGSVHRGRGGIVADRGWWPDPVICKELNNEDIKIKYLISKHHNLDKYKYDYKNVWVPQRWHEQLEKALKQHVPLESRKKLTAGVLPLYHLMLHEPKSLYIMGCNFYMQGSLKDYYDNAIKKSIEIGIIKPGIGRNGRTKRGRFPRHKNPANGVLDITSQVTHHHPLTDYMGAPYKERHSQYFSWKATKIIYDLFDNIDGDPMFKKIMSMSDEEFKIANKLNIED